MSNKKLRITPLGGLGEVGKNMILYEYGDNILVVDTGIMFPENDMLGIDYIIPDFVHVLYDGRIVKSSTKELALELEEKGYDWIRGEVNGTQNID